MNCVSTFALEFQRHRVMAEQAIAGISDEDFVRRVGDSVNPIALIVKHLAGNLASRWSDLLTTDGEKPSRDRDQEFVLATTDTRAALMAQWKRAWETVAATLASLRDDDLQRQVTIRGEPHTVFEALLRGVDHAAYHVGQILYLARLFRPEAPWQTIAPGKSKEYGAGKYLKKP